MTFEDFIKSGGDREEKLVAIYKTKPEALTEEYRSLLRIMESENPYVYEQVMDHDLYGVVRNWPRIKQDLVRQGADFV